MTKPTGPVTFWIEKGANVWDIHPVYAGLISLAMLSFGIGVSLTRWWFGV